MTIACRMEKPIVVKLLMPKWNKQWSSLINGSVDENNLTVGALSIVTSVVNTTYKHNNDTSSHANRQLSLEEQSILHVENTNQLQ